MRFQSRTTLIAALCVTVIAVAIAQAAPAPRATTAGAREVKVLKSINRQLKQLNRNLGTTEKSGLRGQFMKLNADLGSSPGGGLRGQVQDLRRDVGALDQVRNLLQDLQGMPRLLDRIANNTAFEEVP